MADEKAELRKRCEAAVALNEPVRIEPYTLVRLLDSLDAAERDLRFFRGQVKDGHA